LIAAKLNIANGTNAAPIAATVTAADTWLAANPIGSNPSDPARHQGFLLWDTLDDYNDGRLGPSHCGDFTD